MIYRLTNCNVLFKKTHFSPYILISNFIVSLDFSYFAEISFSGELYKALDSKFPALQSQVSTRWNQN